jgi:hypothetical protein
MLEVADDAGLGTGKPYRAELGHRASPKAPGCPHEQLG